MAHQMVFELNLKIICMQMVAVLGSSQSLAVLYNYLKHLAYFLGYTVASPLRILEKRNIFFQLQN